MIITVDGPVASGKSSLAQALAHTLGFYYINSGYLYRTITYLMVYEKLQVPEIRAFWEQKKIRYHYHDGKVSIFYKEQDITPVLKTAEIDMHAPQLSAKAQVRELVTYLQHSIADAQSIVIDGRDCGTIVFPQADYKLYVTADLIVRAERWQKDQEKLGIVVSYNEALTRVAERDKRDMERTISPLRVPEKAYIIDTSKLSRQEALQEALEIVGKMITVCISTSSM